MVALETPRIPSPPPLEPGDQELRALYRFSNRLFRATTRNEIFEAALDALGEAMGCARASILTFDDNGIMRFAAWRGLSRAYRVAVDGHTPWVLSQRDAAPLLIEDIEKTAEPEELKAAIRSESISSLAFIPLTIAGAVVGKFMVYYEQPHRFSPEDLELATMIGGHLSFSLERLRSEQDLTRKRELLEQEIGQRRAAEFAAQRLAAIVESSEDAILAKDLYGIITNWNAAAERLLGYAAEEVIGKSMMMLVPADRCEEEGRILARIRVGERVLPFETVRICKSGEELHVLLSVSPLRDPDGQLVGASTIAHDITERRRAEERQQLLLREMDHRIKNLFTLASGLVTLSARGAHDPAELAETVRERLGALARAHSLTLSVVDDERSTTSLHALIAIILSPYDGDGERITVEGIDHELCGSAVTGLALLLHEFATNAAKYGALSNDTGKVAITCMPTDGGLAVTWTETGGPPVPAEMLEGFGSRLIKATAANQLDGGITRDWRPAGLVVRFTAASSRLIGEV